MSTSGSLENISARNIRTQDRPCHHWQRGNCRFSSACKFRHDPDNEGRFKNVVGLDMVGETNVGPQESATRSSVDTNRPRHENMALKTAHSSRQLRNFERTNINFVPQIQGGSSSIFNGATSGQIEETRHRIASVSDKTKMCRDWKIGRCQRGEKCRFRHDEGAGESSTQPNQPAMAVDTKDKENGEGRGKVEKMSQEHEALRNKAERRNREAEAKKEERMAQERAAREAKEEVLRQERARRMEEEKRRVAERIALEEEARQKRQVEMQALREREAKVVEQHLVLDTSLVTFGAGLDIRTVVAGFDLCAVKIKNLPRDAKRKEIADIFIQQGIKQSDFYISQVRPALNNKLEAVVLANSEYGNAMALGLEDIPFRDESLTFSIDDNAIGNSMDTATRNSPFIVITWRIPCDTVVAGYYSMEEAQRQAQKLNMMTWKGRQIRAVMNERPQGVAGLRNFNPASVKIMNLPFSGHVPYDLHEFTGTTDHKLLKSLSFSVEESYRTIRDRVSKLSGVKIDTYEILTMEGTSEAKVKVQFEEWDDAKEAQCSIGKLPGGMDRPSFKPWLPPRPLRYTIKILLQQYEAQKRQWDELSKTKAGSDAHVQPRIGNRGDVFIQVLGQDKKAVGPLKVRVESMVAGEKLGLEYWHSSWSSNTAKSFFARIFDQKKVFIRNDFKSRSLRAYGEPQLIAEAREMIKEEVTCLAQRETTKILDRVSVGFFVREGLGKLAELLGEENVNLNLASRPCRITVKGGDEANHHLQRMIDESKAGGPSGSNFSGTKEGETCPICIDEASHPEKLVCGHTYCAGCLKHFLTSALDAKSFPLVCMGNDATCNVPIAIPFMRRFMPQTVFTALVEAAFVSYLDRHPQEWKYCTTPDCKQIYRHRAEQAILQCPSCFSTICAACNEEAHEDITCEERRILKNPAEQERLNEQLARDSGYKKCPQCNVWIEKTEGCNHMSCKCGAHICWTCMAISDNRGPFDSDNIYTHMTNIHGNIYAQVPAGINLGPRDNRAFVIEQVDELARIERQRLAAQAQAEAVRVQRIWQVPDLNIPAIVPAQRIQQEARQHQVPYGERARQIPPEDAPYARILEAQRAMALLRNQQENQPARLVEERRNVQEMRTRHEAEERIRTMRLRREAQEARLVEEQRIAQERRTRQEVEEQLRTMRLRREAQDRDRSWCVVM